VSHSGKYDMGTPIKADPHEATEITKSLRQPGADVGLSKRRLAALVAVARTYGLVPRGTSSRQWSARCPRCGETAGVGSLVIEATPTGARFECSQCGALGSRPNDLQRLAESSQGEGSRQPRRGVAPMRIAEALARLDAIVAAGGDVAREACDRIAGALETAENEPNTLTPRAGARLALLPGGPVANDDREIKGGRA